MAISIIQPRRYMRDITPQVTHVIDTYEDGARGTRVSEFLITELPVPPGLRRNESATRHEGIDYGSSYALLLSVTYYFTVGLSYAAMFKTEAGFVRPDGTPLTQCGLAIGLIQQAQRGDWDDALGSNAQFASTLNRGASGDTSWLEVAQWLIDSGISPVPKNVGTPLEDNQVFSRLRTSTPTGAGLTLSGSSTNAGARVPIAAETSIIGAPLTLNIDAEERRQQGFFRQKWDFPRAPIFRQRDSIVMMQAYPQNQTQADEDSDLASGAVQLEFFTSPNFEDLIPFIT